MNQDKNTGRIKTRETALLFIYQSRVRNDDYMDSLRVFRENSEYNAIIDEDKDYFFEITKGVLENQSELDNMYAPFLKNWRIDRLPVLDRIIMEIAIYEINNMEDIHVSVSINEAVKLAKKYGTDNSSSYINGVLSSYEKSL